MTNDQTPKKKSWTSKHKVLVTIAVVLVLLVIIASWDADSAQRGFNEGLKG